MADDTPIPVIGGATAVDLTSHAVGDTFRIFTAVCGENPTTTLLVTDANGLFGLTVDTLRLMQIPGLVPSTLVVGIGYPDVVAMIETVRVRARDLTPTPSSLFPGSGGAGAFADFIADELLPWVAERHPSAVDDTTLFGHSLGGLFAVHMLLTRGSLIDRYIVSSPSLWWDGGRVSDDALAAGDLTGSVFVGIGGLETDVGRRAEATHLPDDHPAKPPAAFLDMVADTWRFVDLLGARRDAGLDLAAIEVSDEFHATVPGVVLSRALRWFFGSQDRTSEPDAADGRP